MSLPRKASILHSAKPEYALPLVNILQPPKVKRILDLRLIYHYYELSNCMDTKVTLDWHSGVAQVLHTTLL
jgi:hypothetical protein